MSCKMRADEVDPMLTATEEIDSLTEEESKTSHQHPHPKPNLPTTAA